MVRFLDMYEFNEILNEDNSINETKNNALFINSLRRLIGTQHIIDNNQLNEYKDIQYRLIIKQYEILFSNQWSILNDKLSSEWEQFKILGFDIDDTTPIKKILGLFIFIYLLKGVHIL